METKPDTIKIFASQREEIQATFADLFVTVKGSSLVSGNAALKKAKEVSQLVDELTRFGLPADAIHLQSVYAETSGGALLRASSATYRLRIRCENLEQFADLLGIVTGQKNAMFERVDWKYPDEAAKEQALEKAIQKQMPRRARLPQLWALNCSESMHSTKLSSIRKPLCPRQCLRHKPLRVPWASSPNQTWAWTSTTAKRLKSGPKLSTGFRV